MRTLAHNWLLVCLLAAAFGLGGAALAASRRPTYTAAATLQVGQVNPNSPGFYSYVTSATALAAAYSRAIAAEPVLAQIHRSLGIAPSVAVSRLSAEPLPQSPAFRVIATGPSARAARSLANAAAGAIVAYESNSNSANPEAAVLLNEYRGAALGLQRSDTRLGSIERAARTKRHASLETVLSEARAGRAAAAAKLAAIGDAYTAAVTSAAPRSGLVSLLAGATSAEGDRSARIQLGALVGVLIGLAVGAALAAGRERYGRPGRRQRPSIESG